MPTEFYKQNCKHAFGSLPPETYKPMLDLAVRAAQEVHASAELPGLLTLPDGLHARLQQEATSLRGSFSDIVLVGTGGSSLGAKALAALAPANAPRLHLLENADPNTAHALMQQLDITRTLFLIISKSGGTVEVLAHMLALLEPCLRVLGHERLKHHMRVVTEPKQSALMELATFYDLEVIPHAEHIGGRYSVFSVVGVLPALLLGLDTVAFRAGAERVLDHFLQAASDPQQAAKNAPVRGAALQLLHLRQGRGIHVYMPYCDRLHPLSYWYRQLVAESLGKQHLGITPLTALGAVDQHSMLQLFLQGPPDKWFTLLLQDARGLGQMMQAEHVPDAVAYLAGRTLGDVMYASQTGTVGTLIRHHMPLRIIELQQVHEGLLGALMMHWIIETVLSARMLGVNPYDQPAVEEGKQLARTILADLGQVVA